MSLSENEQTAEHPSASQISRQPGRCQPFYYAEIGTSRQGCTCSLQGLFCSRWRSALSIAAAFRSAGLSKNGTVVDKSILSQVLLQPVLV